MATHGRHVPSQTGVGQMSKISDLDNKWNEDFCTFFEHWELDKIEVKNNRMIK